MNSNRKVEDIRSKVTEFTICEADWCVIRAVHKGHGLHNFDFISLAALTKVVEAVQGAICALRPLCFDHLFV